MAVTDLVNAMIFVGAALVLVGMLSSLVATRFGAPLLLVFLVVGMLAGEDGPGGIVFEDYRATYLVGMISLSVILFDGGLRTRLSSFRGVLAPSLLLATVGVLVTAAVVGGAVWWALGLAPVEGLLLGSIIASTDAAAVFFLIRTGGLRLPHRVGATLEIESSTNDPVSVFLVILLTELLLAHGHMGFWELTGELLREGLLGAGLGLAGGALLVGILNRVAMPGGLHPLFVVTGAITIAGFTMVVGGSGLLAVYVAGLVMANRPTRAYPSIVGFHDAVTWLCQIVMFLVLGLLVTPSTLWTYAPEGLFVAVILTLVARPLAVWLCLRPFGFSRAEKLFVSWVGLRGAVSIFLAAIPQLAGLPGAPTYFNIAFFVVFVSLLVQGSTLTSVARRLGIALRQTTPSAIRVEIDIPGQTEQEIVGYPVTAESIILGLSRLPPWARIVLVVRKGQILEPAAAGALRPGDYCYFLVSRQRLPRLDSLFRTSPDVARRLGLLFGELAIRGETRVDELAQLYDLDLGPHAPGETLAEWMAARLDGHPTLDAEVRIPRAALLVRRLESGRIASVGLQLEDLMQVEPDERLLARLEEDADHLAGLRRWLAGLSRRA
jgi:cell volume regulation protein A